MKHKNFFKHGMIRNTAFVLLSLFLLKAEVLAFGLECWVDGKRYHYNITLEAVKNAGFTPDAAEIIAWENDGLDVYINDPTVDVYNFMKPEWDRPHFDNLFNTSEIKAEWNRYLYGAFYGLLWAREQNNVLAGFNILAVLLHATQDFYSHSTWVDVKDRRGRTYFDCAENEIDATKNIWTGWYKGTGAGLLFGSVDANSPDTPGHDVTFRASMPSWMKPHGGEGGWNETRLAGCEDEGNKGISLDRIPSAKTAFDVRDLDPEDKKNISWETLFNGAKSLATKNSQQVLAKMEEWMMTARAGDFWNSLKTYHGEKPTPPKQESCATCPAGWNWAQNDWRKSFYRKEAQNLSTMPFAFITSGDYPYSGGENWYFRLQIETDSSKWGGTDGDVYFHIVNGSDDKKFLLDRVDIDDFVGGDDDAFYVGPIKSFPNELRLTLDSQDGLQIKRVRVWAYRIGGKAAYGKLADANDIQIGNDIVTEWTGPGGVIPVPATKSYKWETSVNETQLTVFPFEITPYKELISATAVVGIPAITPEMLSTTRAFTNNLPYPLKAIYIYGDSERSGKNFQTVGVEYEDTENLGSNLELGAYSWYTQPGMNNKFTYEYIPYEPQPLLPKGGLTRVTVRMACTQQNPEAAISTEKLSVIIYKSQAVPLVEIPVDFSRSWSCPSRMLKPD